jgi:DNA-binding MarR family transcriptional regulator
VPAITRVLDRLTELGLARRGPDPRDGRSVLVQRTRLGGDFLGDLRGRGGDEAAKRTPEMHR